MTLIDLLKVITDDTNITVIGYTNDVIIDGACSWVSQNIPIVFLDRHVEYVFKSTLYNSIMISIE